MKISQTFEIRVTLKQKFIRLLSQVFIRNAPGISEKDEYRSKSTNLTRNLRVAKSVPMPPRRSSTTCSPWGRGLAGRNSALCCSRRSAISHVEVARAGSGTCTFRLSRAPGRTRIHASPVRPDRHVHTSACIINVMHAQWRIQVFLVARKPPWSWFFFNLPRSVIILMHCQCCT